ncbi:hypothetical protein K443DRAFT_645540, partial [Laccaria amethystina LaAM-08-1]
MRWRELDPQTWWRFAQRAWWKLAPPARRPGPPPDQTTQRPFTSLGCLHKAGGVVSFQPPSSLYASSYQPSVFQSSLSSLPPSSSRL